MPSKEEQLQKFLDAKWRCSATGLPLVFPPTLCLLERMTTCANQHSAAEGFGIYDLRQSMANAPLCALTYPQVSGTTLQAVRAPSGTLEARYSGDAWCDHWDGMLGVFLRLYHPSLPELSVDWNYREHRNDAGYLTNWYAAVHTVLAARPNDRARYQHLEDGPGLWPAPPA